MQKQYQIKYQLAGLFEIGDSLILEERACKLIKKNIIGNGLYNKQTKSHNIQKIQLTGKGILDQNLYSEQFDAKRMVQIPDFFEYQMVYMNKDVIVVEFDEELIEINNQQIRDELYQKLKNLYYQTSENNSRQIILQALIIDGKPIIHDIKIES